MGQIAYNGLTVHRYYVVSGMPSVPDSARCPLDPTEAWVTFHSDRLIDPPRAAYVTIKGRRLRGTTTRGTFNQGGYSILPDGTVKSNEKTGSAPLWVQEVVNRAIAEHAAGVGLAPVTASA